MNTAVSLFAAFCTTISYFPQLKKCWETSSAGDLSLKMFLILALGVTSWIVYGFLQGDLVIIIANSASLSVAWHHPLQAAGRSGRRRPLNCAAKNAVMA